MILSMEDWARCVHEMDSCTVDVPPKWPSLVKSRKMSRPVPRCAICEQRLVKGQQMGVLGTEAVHSDCLRTGALTVGQRKDQLIAEAQAVLERANRTAERAIAEANTAAAAAKTVSEERELAAALLATVAAERDRLRAERNQMADQLAGLRTALRNAQRSPRRDDVQTLAKARQEEAQADNRDATEVRFSLLELDTGKALG